MKEYRIYKETEISSPNLQVRYMDHLHGAPEYVKAVQIWYDIPMNDLFKYLEVLLKLPTHVGKKS